MTTLPTTRAVSLAAVIAFSAVGAARGQFYLTGNVQGASGSRATGISADGLVVSGYSVTNNGPNSAFTWSAAGGRTDFGTQLSGISGSSAYAISGDGGTVVGAGVDASGRPRAFRYRGPGTYQSLGTITNYSISVALGASGDASVIAGDVRDTSGAFSLAFRWTEGDGMHGLGVTRPEHYNSHANGVSRDGRSIVGSSNGASTQDGFIWTQDAGMRALHGIGGADAEATAVNAIGSIVVGSYLNASSNVAHAMMWRDGSTIDLGVGAGILSSYASDVSDDGAVVAGNAILSDFFTERACVWTPGTGMILLGTYFASNGISVPSDWVFTQCTGVSADGRTFTGLGNFPSDNAPRAFVATVPTPAGLATLICGAGWAVTRRRRYPD